MFCLNLCGKSHVRGPAASARSLHRDALFGCAALAVTLLLQGAGIAQSSVDHAVLLRIELQLPERAPSGSPRRTRVKLQPLQGEWTGETIAVSEGQATEIRVPPGRYQITSTDPVKVEGQAYGWDVEIPATDETNELRLSPENAVWVSDTASAEDSSAAVGAPSIHRGKDAIVPDPAVRAEIEVLLQRWTSSLRNHDLAEQMSCYGSRLAEYFRQRNVGRDYVLSDKERFLTRYPDIRQLTLSDVRIFEAAQLPEATAVKTWSFGGRKDWAGQVVTHLRFAKEDGHWVIVSERERLVTQNSPF